MNAQYIIIDLFSICSAKLSAGLLETVVRQKQRATCRLPGITPTICSDRALAIFVRISMRLGRAMSTSSSSGKSIGSWRVESANLLVKGIPSAISESELHDVFAYYGVVQSCRLISGPLRVAFVAFTSSKEAYNAISALDGVQGLELISIPAINGERLFTITNRPVSWRFRIPFGSNHLPIKHLRTTIFVVILVEVNSSIERYIWS
jgi:hypothetical protein